MNNNKSVRMIGWWENQRREININLNDDINTIERTASTRYQLQQINEIRDYQIQYYHSEYQKFIDLYSDSFDTFQELLRKLLSDNPPPKSAKEWMLKIVPRTFRIKRCTINEPLPDDTYSYQQENDSQRFLQIEEPTNIQSSSLPVGSGTNNSQTVSRDPTSQNIDKEEEEKEKDTVQSDLQLPPSITDQPHILVTPDHPYGLKFDTKLIDHQRLQYEKDINRASSSNESTKGGVRLHACPRSDETSANGVSYPMVHFDIPIDEQSKKWFLLQTILTEADNNGVHYLHASKSIHHHHDDEERDDQCVAIQNTKLVNPYVVELTIEQTREGRVQLLTKVCNLTDVTTRKKEQLREFSRSTTSKNYKDLILPSANTTCGLHFSNEKFHLCCALMSENVIYDQCISNVTTAVSGQKLNETKPGEGGSKKKKIKRE